MKKLVFGEPIVLAQSPTAAILFDGYQDPHIRSNQKGEIFVSYHVRRDCDETFGQEDNDPILKTTDGGKTWAPCTDISEWVKCGTLLANGDVFSFREEASIPLDPNMPLPDKEQRTVHAIA
ncbi:MAG: glycoside hydrolase, partial [Clostridia bacterium]|nr:glycoside hydrolase [Clostridia bacterium]